METHKFTKTMTSIEKSASGFVTLDKWTDENRTQLELVGIEIPYGYTLIIEKDCIHGDATLSSIYMMCMTSNHKTMNTADITFLKNPLTKKNVSISIEGKKPAQSTPFKTHPFAIFKQDLKHNQVAFNALVKKNKKCIQSFCICLNPLFRERSYNSKL